VTYKETFLIHIITVLRLHTVMVHLLPQNIEILPERRFRLRLMPLEVESVGISAVKDGLAPTLKSADQFLLGSEPHIREAHVCTIAGAGGRRHS
jgi:hypothetical protein